MAIFDNLLFTGGADGGLKVWDLWDWLPVELKQMRQSNPPWTRSLYQFEEIASPTNDHEYGARLNPLNLDELNTSSISCYLEQPLLSCPSITNGTSREGSSLVGRIHSSDWLRCIALDQGGRLLFMGTNNGRIYCCNILTSSALDPHASKGLELELMYQSVRRKPIMVIRSFLMGQVCFLGVCDIEGKNILIEVHFNTKNQKEIRNYLVFEWSGGAHVLPGPGLDLHIVEMFGEPTALASSSSGFISLYKVSSMHHGDFIETKSFQCPNKSRIISFCVHKLHSDGKDNIVAFGSGSGGISIWRMHQDEEDGECVHVECISNVGNAHDKTPVQWISISTTNNFGVFEVQSSGCNSCVQHYYLNIVDKSLRRTNERRYEPILVVSGRQGKSLVYGFYNTNFVVWDEKLDAELCRVFCPSWRRSWAKYINSEKEKIVFCYEAPHKRIYLYSRGLVKNDKDGHVTTGIPRSILIPSHGREINDVIYVPPNLIFTAGEDATMRCVSFDEEIVPVSCLVSSQPGGTAIRTLGKKETDQGWLIVTGGAKKVLTVWLVDASNPVKARNISTHADVTVRNRKKNPGQGGQGGYGDIRVTAMSLLSPKSPNMILVLVICMSDGKIEVRYLPRELPTDVRFHTWPLLAILSTPYHLECPVLAVDSIENEIATLVTAGTSQGDVFIWRIEGDVLGDMTSQVCSENCPCLLPCLAIEAVHQSGVNDISACLAPPNKDSVIIITGGDDQSLRYMEVSVDGMGLLHQPIPENNAHGSAVRAVWTNGHIACSVGLDQKIRCWWIKRSDLLIEKNANKSYLQEMTECSRYLHVLEPAAMDVIQGSKESSFLVTVAGRGIETLALE